MYIAYFKVNCQILAKHHVIPLAGGPVQPVYLQILTQLIISTGSFYFQIQTILFTVLPIFYLFYLLHYALIRLV